MARKIKDKQNLRFLNQKAKIRLCNIKIMETLKHTMEIILKNGNLEKYISDFKIEMMFKDWGILEAI